MMAGHGQKMRGVVQGIRQWWTDDVNQTMLDRQAFSRLRIMVCVVGISGATIEGENMDWHRRLGMKCRRRASMKGKKMEGHRALVVKSHRPRYPRKTPSHDLSRSS